MIPPQDAGEIAPPKRRSRSEASKASASAAPAVLPSAPGDNGRALADELSGKRERGSVYADGDLKPEDLKLGGGNARIVTHLFQRDEDPMETYRKIRASLRLGTRASAASAGQLLDALDAAEENAMEAFELLINAKVAHDAFEIDSKVVLGAIRSAAYAILQDEKAKGVRSKAITDADVESVMAANHPEDWQLVQEQIGKAKRTVDLLSELYVSARERAKDLRAMVSKSRGDA